MGTNYTDIATVEPLVSAIINDRLDELDANANPSAATLDIPIVAGEALAIREAVYISTGAGGKTAGRAYRTDADDANQSSTSFARGFATSAIASGSTGAARILGVLSGFTGLTAGAPQFASATAGALTESEPGNSLLMGLAISTTEIMVNSRGDQGAVYATGDLPSEFGYILGGNTGGGSFAVVTADRITFSTTVTAANTDSDLSEAKLGARGVSDLTTYGYVAGGQDTGLNFTVTADRITFSTGVTAANTDSDLATSIKAYLGSLSDGSTYGYFAGGSTSLFVLTDTADRITFSTGVTAANTDSDLVTAKSQLFSVSDGSTYGYFAGGDTNSANYEALADRITFSTGVTAANTDSALSVARGWGGELSDSSTYGYFLGGLTDSSTEVVTADRITFSTGVTAANTDSDLSVAAASQASLSSGAFYGYILGGSTGAAVLIADAYQLSFSTGVTAANTDSDLSIARYGPASLAEGSV